MIDIKNQYNKIPIRFTKRNDFKVKDTRFIPVTIDLMHLGKNANGSYFSREVVERAIPSLANTPILAYIEKTEDGDDFSDHRREYEDGKFKYLGQAIGVIGETNNARFEEKPDEEGNMRTYLVVDGLIWTKWDTPIEIFDKRNGKVSESMELHDNFEGTFNDEDGLFHFTYFNFYGACALGKNVEPAMSGANIKINFHVEDFSKEIQTKMEEFKEFQRKIKGGELMNEKLELLKKYSKTIEDLGDINLEEMSVEDLEQKLMNLSEKDTKTSEGEEAELEQPEELENSNPDDTDYKKLYEDLGKDNDALKEEFSKLEDEVKGLREFKQNTLADQRKAKEEKLFSQYAVLENVKEFEMLKLKSAEFGSVADLEKEIALIFAKESMKGKIDFSKKEDLEDEEKNKFNFSIDNDINKSAYGGLFEKYAN